MQSYAKTERVLRVDGLDLEVATWEGRGIPVLLAHEALGSVYMWRDFPARLAAATGRTVVAWSRAGHGRSTIPGRERPHDYLPHEAAAMLSLMDAAGIPRAHLYGHSDGTSIALIAAAMAPGRVASLVLEAAHVVVEPMTADGIRIAVDAYRTSDFRARLARHHRDPDHVFESWHRIWLDPEFGDWSIEHLLPSVRAPALLIHGERDQYFTIKQVDLIDAALADVERLELADCGHSPHREKPEAVLAAVTAFLARVSDERLGASGASDERQQPTGL